ncbi:APC amino acid permease [Macrolepiota fuliginosa MF-IS2]|uniref:APC amino acid permease n=1 Tax=Macrolepiota fuliginosa MF-IS2 TaxID=1400762 RepID=A0A9P5X9I1_9AGAR|nr:APC amino acid permease [Macrolepiota fuliginosa MF-IS2]
MIPKLRRRQAVHQADEALLAALGYKQEFRREFTPLEVFGIAFSIIGLVPSISSVLFYAIPNGGGPAMVWGWLVASIFILLVGLSMAELASAAPTSGGLYFWTYSLASKKWRNLLCWIVGYANTIGSVGGIASIDWGAAVQVTAAVTIVYFRLAVIYLGLSTIHYSGIYTAIVISHAVACCLGTRVLARLQTVYVALNILLSVALIIALPAATPKEFKNSAKFALGDFTNLSGWPNGFAFVYSFLAPLWTIGSFDSSVHISEEASNAAIAVPWVIVGAVSMGGILGCAINISLAFCMGSDVQALADSAQPMAQILVNSFGRNATLGVWVLVVLFLAASRQTFAFSRDGALPFSNWLYRMNPHTKTPVNVVCFDGLLALALGLLIFAGQQAINAIFSMSIVATYIAYAIPIIVRFTGGNNFQPGPFTLGAFGLPIAITAVLFMFFIAIVFFFPGSPGVGSADMNYSVVVVGGTLALSTLWYYFPKYGGVHWFKGPNLPDTSGPSEHSIDVKHSDSVEVHSK